VETDYNNALRGRFARSVREAENRLDRVNPVRAWPSAAGFDFLLGDETATYQTWNCSRLLALELTGIFLCWKTCKRAMANMTAAAATGSGVAYQ
jgi:hypothetical protein